MKVDIYITILIIIALSSFLLGIHGENCNPGYGTVYHDIRSSGSCDNYITTAEECRKASVVNQPYDDNNGYDGIFLDKQSKKLFVSANDSVECLEAYNNSWFFKNNKIYSNKELTAGTVFTINFENNESVLVTI